MTSFSGLSHVALATGDLDATIRFWRDLLGCRLVGRLGRPGQRAYFFDAGRGTLIGFFEWPGTQPIPEKAWPRSKAAPCSRIWWISWLQRARSARLFGRKRSSSPRNAPGIVQVPVAGPFAFDHVALAVGSLEDLFRLKDRFEAAGVSASDVTDHGFLYSVYLHDPNGITVECCCAARDVDIATDPVAIEQAPTPVAAQGADPDPAAYPAPTAHGDWPVVPGTGYRAFVRD